MNIIGIALKNKFRLLLICLAILVGVLYVAPELLIWKKLRELGKPYVAIQLTHHGDEALGTVSRYREIYDGHFPPGDLFLDNNTATPFGPLQFMPLLMAVFIYIFKGNINVSYLAATFVLAPVVFLLFCWLGKAITNNRIFAIFFALLGTLTPIFRAVPQAFRSVSLFMGNILNYFIPLVRTPLAKLPLGRTEDPLLTYLGFLPAIAALLIFWKKPSWKSGALSGALIGLMFYIYFHYWVFLVIVAGLIGIFALSQIKKDPNFFKSVLILFGALTIVTIPYWINFFIFQNSPTAEEVTRRIGVEVSRAPFFIAGEPAIAHYVFYALLGILVYFVFFRRGQKRIAALYWIFIAAMFAAWNVQVITGFVPAPDHWFRPIGAFFAVILFHALYELCKKFDYQKVAAVLIIGSALLISKKIVNALVFVNPPQQFIDDKSFESRSFNPSIADSWGWINKNLPGEPKIISPSFITTLYLYTQTPTRPYLLIGFNTGASNRLLDERFLTTYKLFNVPQQHLERILRMDYSKDFKSPEKFSDSPYPDQHTYLNLAEPITHLYFGAYYKEGHLSTTTYRFVSKEKADELIAAYPKIAVNWKEVDADYVYYGPWEKQITKINLALDPNLDLVFKNQEVEIYRILRPMK